MNFPLFTEAEVLEAFRDSGRPRDALMRFIEREATRLAVGSPCWGSVWNEPCCASHALQEVGLTLEAQEHRIALEESA